MTVDAKVQIGNTGEFLEGTSVTTPAGANLFREGVVISDPELPEARCEVRQIGTALTDLDYGLVTHSIIQGKSSVGGGTYIDAKVNPSGSLLVEASTNGTPLDTVNVNTTGTWGYKAGVSGTPTIPANAKILQISASAPIETPGSLTINGGDSLPIPSGASVGFEPCGNLITPTIVFTGTESYLVEYVT